MSRKAFFEFCLTGGSQIVPQPRRVLIPAKPYAEKFDRTLETIVLRQERRVVSEELRFDRATGKTLHPLVPVLGAVPLQLLAYHIAVECGCDVDRPRNLAKSVTVE